MGRYYYHRKATADESCRLKMSDLKKDGMLSGCVSGTRVWTSSRTGKTTNIIGLAVDVTNEPHAKLTYTVTDKQGNKTDYDYEVSLLTTPCYYGGVRYWFGCPHCGRRIGTLYLAPGDVYFKCRHCNNLSYRSRSRSGIELWGHIGRQIESLRGQIKRWTWRSRPTRKARRLQTLERKAGILGSQAITQLDRLRAKF